MCVRPYLAGASPLSPFLPATLPLPGTSKRNLHGLGAARGLEGVATQSKEGLSLKIGAQNWSDEVRPPFVFSVFPAVLRDERANSPEKSPKLCNH